MAAGFPVKANYVTGEVLTAANMNDLSGTVNILQSTQYAAGKNAIINGGFDIWQRGTSFNFANTSSNYSSDRWAAISATVGTMTRQTTSDTTNLPNIQYCARIQRTAAQTGTSAIGIYQFFESVNAIPYAGQTVTLSFYARKGANFSAASNALAANLYTGTGTDQNPFVAYTGSANPITGTATLTTTWQRFTFTGTLAATATELYISLGFTPVGTAGAADYYEITGVQLELSTTATTFSRAGGTIQGELAACQRYFFLEGFGKSVAQRIIGTGGYVAAGDANCVVHFPVTMRTTPTLIIATGATNYAFSSAGNALDYVSSLTIINSSPTTALLYNATETSSTAGQAAICLVVNNPGSIGFSAEL